MKLCFGYQSRVGKDTACEYLQNQYSGTILHFSDPLYAILHYSQDVCGFEKVKDPTFLQNIGMWARNQNKNVWVNNLEKKIGAGNTFVTDARFINEIEMLKRNGFKCVKITKPDRVIDRNPNHVSETELSSFQDWDYEIVNNGSIDDLYKKIDEMLNFLFPLD